MAKINTEGGTERFAKAYHSILFEKKLSADTRLLLIYALDNKPEWKFVSKNASTKLNFSKKIMTRVLNELEDNGYLIREKLLRRDRKFDYTYKFLLIPLPPELIIKKPKPGNKKKAGTSTPKVSEPNALMDTGTSSPKVTEPVSQTAPYNHTPFNQTNCNNTFNQTTEVKNGIEGEKKPEIKVRVIEWDEIEELKREITEWVFNERMKHSDIKTKLDAMRWPEDYHIDSIYQFMNRQLNERMLEDGRKYEEENGLQ